jgi:hypothetical protein
MLTMKVPTIITRDATKNVSGAKSKAEKPKKQSSFERFIKSHLEQQDGKCFLCGAAAKGFVRSGPNPVTFPEQYMDFRNSTFVSICRACGAKPNVVELADSKAMADDEKSNG